MQKHRYALRLAYDGAAFRGYQRQPGMETVQSALESALAHLGGRVRVEAAARTDAGVHAVDQVVTFTTRAVLDPARLRATINAYTPPSLICTDAAVVPPSFHARSSALSRTYVYLVGWPAPDEVRGRAWCLPDPRAFPAIDAPVFHVARAKAALGAVLGEHDFGGFARAGDQTSRRATDPRATVTAITRADIVAALHVPLIAFVIEGRSFLRAMIRHIVGAVVSAAVGAAEPSLVAEVLAAPHQRYRGVRAPGWGLTLARVRYPHPPFP